MEQNLFLVSFLALTVGVGSVLSILNLLGGSLYDIRQIKQEKARLLHPFAKPYRHKPLISIIIPAHNKATVIERTLNSIVSNSYRSYEIIIVDDASTDDTKKFVRKFIKSHKKRVIKILSTRKPLGRSQAINAGFKKWARGELIMVLDGGSMLDKNALLNLTRHYAASEASIIIPHLRTIELPSIISLIQQFKQLTSQRSRKLNSLISAEWNAGGSGVIYAQSLFKNFKGFKSYLLKPDTVFGLKAASDSNDKHRLHYAHDVVVYTEPVSSYKRLLFMRYRQKSGLWQALRSYKNLFFSRDKGIPKSLTWFRLPLSIWEELMVLLEPLIVAYFIYVAVAFGQPLLVIIGWCAVSFLLISTIWADNQQSWRKKAKLTAMVPIMYPLLLIMALIDVIVTFISIINIKKTTPTKNKPHRTKRLQSTKKLAPQT